MVQLLSPSVHHDTAGPPIGCAQVLSLPSAHGTCCFFPDPLYFVRLLPYRRPVIVEPAQVTRLLDAADKLVSTVNSPLLPAVMRMAVKLLYTAGLRRGELVPLTLDDVEARTGLLRIRASKFHKSRLVRLSPAPAMLYGAICANGSRHRSIPLRARRCCVVNYVAITDTPAPD